MLVGMSATGRPAGCGDAGLAQDRAGRGRGGIGPARYGLADYLVDYLVEGLQQVPYPDGLGQVGSGTGREELVDLGLGSVGQTGRLAESGRGARLARAASTSGPAAADAFAGLIDLLPTKLVIVDSRFRGETGTGCMRTVRHISRPTVPKWSMNSIFGRIHRRIYREKAKGVANMCNRL
jgi:hypothetical protein